MRIKDSFGSRLMHQIRRRDMAIREFSQLCDISESQMRRYINDDREPTFSNFIKIVAAFRKYKTWHLDVDDLLFQDNGC